MDVESSKYHPVGPTCTYKGKTITCLVKLSEGGGISGNIITNVLKHLGDFKLYENDRKNGIFPALLVDGNVSCFYMGF